MLKVFVYIMRYSFLVNDRNREEDVNQLWEFICLREKIIESDNNFEKFS